MHGHAKFTEKWYGLKGLEQVCPEKAPVLELRTAEVQDAAHLQEALDVQRRLGVPGPEAQKEKAEKYH